MSDQDILMRKSPHHDKKYNKRYNKNQNKHHKHGSRKKKRIILICVLCILGVLIAGGAYAASVLINSNKYDANTMFTPKNESAIPSASADLNAQEPALPEDSILYQGEVYNYNQDVVNIVFMGVDYNKNIGIDGESVSGGQADTLLLIAINTNNNKMTLLNIPRDTMSPIKIYDLNQNYTGMKTAQIALAHAYGDGEAMSNELTVDAVSALFNGLPIYRYMGLDVEGIPAATDAVGGVTVTAPDDFKLGNKQVKKGEQITLNGTQAQTYVQSRDDDLTANLARMDRQTSYLKGFFEALKSKTKENLLFPVTLYQEVGEYASTDMNLSEIAYIARSAIDSGLKDENILTVPGKAQVGDNSVEYIVDEDALFKIMLDTFYLKQPSAAQPSGAVQ